MVSEGMYADGRCLSFFAVTFDVLFFSNGGDMLTGKREGSLRRVNELFPFKQLILWLEKKDRF